MTEEFAELLANIKWIKSTIRFGCDTPKQIAECEKAISMLERYGFKGSVFLYTMLTDNFTESYDRITYWWRRNQEQRRTKKGRPVYPYCQPYRDPIDASKEPPKWQKDMARWCNARSFFQTIELKDYSPRKNFCFSEYIDKLYRK